ncbi:MAG TPA: hypothetical protein VFV55_04595 [Usitatibacteraceae bacterium]|nr:hypothetical protein [Usitatibacteraceae bacterium]
MKNDEYTDVPATLAVALGLWAGAVAAATRAEIFARLPGEAYAALVAFAIAFALSVVTMDARVRGWLDLRGMQSASLALLGMAGLMVATGVELARGGAIDPAAAPWAPMALFGVPVTLALGAAALGALRREAKPGVTRPASTGPVRRPGATSGSRTSASSPRAARARAAG